MALGVPRVLELIPAPGALMDRVKRKFTVLEPPDRKGVELQNYFLSQIIPDLRKSSVRREAIRHELGLFPAPFLPGKHPELHELFLFKEFCWHYIRLQKAAKKVSSTDALYWPILDGFFAMLDRNGSGLPVFHLSPDYDPKLKELTNQKRALLTDLAHEKARHLRQASEELKLPDLKEEFILPRSKKELCAAVLRSGHFITVAESFANLTFRLDDSPKALHFRKKLDSLQSAISKAEDGVLRKIGGLINKRRKELERAVWLLESFAWTFMLADFAITHGCCVPVHSEDAIDIRGAENLPLKLHLAAKGMRYQKIDLRFDQPGNLITGPNMGGKTSLLRTLGQLCALRVLGIPLPCASARLPWFETIWYNQDDPDAVDDLSAFGREVVSFTAALEEPTPALFLLDEFAKGTNPAEGEALVGAVLKHLVAEGRFCVAATHFTAPALLKHFAQYSIPGITITDRLLANAMAIRPDERLKLLAAAMDYRPRRLKNGAAPPRCAIGIARLLGMPAALLDGIEIPQPSGREP